MVFTFVLGIFDILPHVEVVLYDLVYWRDFGSYLQRPM